MMKQQAKWVLAGVALMVGTAFGTTASAGAQAAQPRYPVPGGGSVPAAPQYPVVNLPQPAPITPNGAVVEDVVVRVNDQIITRTELERSEQQLLQDAQANSVPAADVADKQKDMLRDMIDQQLLLSKAKELGFSCDAELSRRLDEIRKQNHLDSMEALERAASQQGVSFEDFKKGICNNILTQQVVRDEVGRSVSRSMTRSAEAAYYTEHAKEFDQPESVHLSEILVPTPETATDEQLAQAQVKATEVVAKIRAGMTFAAAAKQYSGGPGASTGGDLGDFKRGALAKVLEDPTFAQTVGSVTDPIRTRQGYVILRTDKHTAAGAAPLADVEPQVQEAMYMNALQPALRTYLTKQREEAYVDIKPGFVDTGSNRREVKPVFTTYTPPPVKKKTEVKRRMEQQKDALAQQRLADAREKAAEKAAAKAAKSNGGLQTVAMPVKQKKISREKVRFGQAPRNSLPSADVPTTVQGADAPLEGQAPGVAMAGTTNSNVTVTKGTGTVDEENPLAVQAGPRKKTRYTARQADIELAKASDAATKAHVHTAAKPIAATTQEAADEKEQAAPLGLNGDTGKKKPKAKRQKGDPKERLQEKPKQVDTTPAIAPTVNPSLGTDALPAEKASAAGSPADKTALPSSTTAPNAINPTAPPVNSSSPNPVPPPQ